MQNIFRILIITITLSAMALPAIAQAPLQWSADPSRNMLLEVKDLPDQLSDENLLWQVDVKGSFMFSQPTLHKDRIIFGGTARYLEDPVLSKVPTKSSLVCLDANNGERIWEMPMGRNPYGLCSTAVPDGDQLYIVTASGNVMCIDLNGMADGNDGDYQDELSYFAQSDDALTTETRSNWGDILWYRNIRKDYNVTWHDAPSATPLLIGDQVWIATSQSYHTNHPYTEKGYPQEIEQWAPNILVFDKNSGQLIAKDNLIIPRIYHGQWSSLAMAENEGKKYVVFGDGAGYCRLFDVDSAVDPENPDEVQVIEEIWRYNVNPPEELELEYPSWRTKADNPEGRRRRAEGPCEIISTPMVDGNRIYVALGRDYNYCYKIGKRAMGSSRLVCLDLTAPVKNIREKWYLKDLSDEGVLWSTRDVGRTMTSFALEDGLLYIADMKGKMNCYDAETGEKYWDHDIGSKAWSASPLLADGKLYVSTADRDFFIFKADKEKKLLFETTLEPGIATATAQDGVLYVFNSRKLSAYSGK
jgi:outer membrane protein assembly factor BamB